ncbi:LCP family protein [Paenibacillus qinlingensis]|uniref:LCP family protein required for cell wall assembly n=1 Tax=Paenibacillus qinlingensis TaxID=1837343 RepID=A0ABU1P2B1_9BACL|nr:LCP family protein [Paenibacillus qinlingensis]MDR6553888.1 LCP family protein required for cell wall assembly [Paenibacillus qinlingensis]
MKRRAIYYFVASLGLASSCWIYLSFEPNHHFQGSELPVLSTPNYQAISSYPINQSNQPAQLNDDTKIVQSEPTAATIKVDKAEKYSSFNVLILGTDAIGNEDSRSDVIIVAHVMPNEKKVAIVSIPRDSRVAVDNVGYTKINHAHIVGELHGGNKEGTQLVLQTVSSFLNIPINYYVKTNFRGFINMIDEIGGIDIEVMEDIYLGESSLLLHQGMQHIDGATTLSLVRERHSLQNGDFGRQFNQSQVLKEIAVKLLQPKQLPKLPKLLSLVKKDISDTNFSDGDLLSLAWLLNGVKASDFSYIQIPGHSSLEMDPLVKNNVWYWIPDMDEVKKITQDYFQRE